MPTTRQKSRGPLVVLLGGPLLLVGYVLSIGPTARLACDDNMDVATWAAIYRPIIWSTENLPTPIYVAVRWYCQRWGVDYDLLVFAGLFRGVVRV